jgi:hypothetical protein
MSDAVLDMDEVRHVATGEAHWFTTKMARRILELEARLVEAACICEPFNPLVPGQSPGHAEKSSEVSQ